MHSFKRFFCFTLAVVILGGSGYVYAGNPNSYPYFEREYVTFTDRNRIKTQDMRHKSQICEEVLRQYLTRFPNLLGIASTLIEVQEEYSVNAIMLLAIIRLESGNGRSNLAVSHNNLGGIKAPANSVAVFRSFDSKADCVWFMGRLLANQYLTEGGRFFSGFTIVDVGRRYAASPQWPVKVRNLMFEIQAGLNSIAYELANSENEADEYAAA